MLKIAVFGFFHPDTDSDHAGLASPLSPDDFMRTVWALEPPDSRVGRLGVDAAPCFVKLTRMLDQPVYVQLLNEDMAAGAGQLNCDGYVVLLDAVKILAPNAIHHVLHRLHAENPRADLVIAAGRHNEPEALAAEEIRAMLGLHPDLPVYPYVPDDPQTVARVIREVVALMADDHPTAPIFAGEEPPPAPVAQAAPVSSTGTPSPADPRPPAPRIHGLDHVAITVSDLERALDFYRGLLGFRLLGHLDFPEEPRGFTIAYLETGTGVLELFSFNDAPARPSGWDADDTQVGLRHLALRVTGLDAIAEQLECAGVPFTLPPTDAHGGVRICFFTDPDGTLVELVEGDLVYTRR